MRPSEALGVLGSPRGALGGGADGPNPPISRGLRVPGGGDPGGVKVDRAEASGGEGGELSILSRAK